MARKSENIYAIYKGDAYVDMGTAHELAEKYGLKTETIWWLSSKNSHKRVEKGKNYTIVIKVEDIEDDQYIILGIYSSINHNLLYGFTRLKEE